MPEEQARPGVTEDVPKEEGPAHNSLTVCENGGSEGRDCMDPEHPHPASPVICVASGRYLPPLHPTAHPPSH